MEYKEIRELALLLNEMGLTSLEYSAGGETVKLERKPGVVNIAGGAPVSIPVHHEAQREEIATAGGFTVKSPMVGVYYSSPSTDMAPYVEVGSAVHAGDVLCIIEAMKIMNEITAERDGVITEICVEDRQLVEFNQPLFRIGDNPA